MTEEAAALAVPDEGRVEVREVRARLREVVADSERDPAEHATLRARLDAVPEGRRKRPWREASLLTDLAFRARPKRARDLLRTLRERDVEADRLDRFEALWAQCAAAMAPYTLGPHGYQRALGQRDAGAVWAEVETVCARLDALGHPCFVNSGTLLGLVRDGGLIGHDDDVDLAVLLEADDDAGAADAWARLKAELAAAGLLDEEFEALGKDHCRVRVHDVVEVDLFAAWLVDGRVHVWPHTRGEAGADDLLPLAVRRVEGHDVPLPRHPEPFLEANYGPGWREPDPTFRFDWGAAKERYAGFLAALAAARAGEDPAS